MRRFWRKKQQEDKQQYVPIAGLPKFEEHSPTWRWIKEQLAQKLQQAREDNDASGRDMMQTAYLRGRISVYKELLDIPGEERNARQQAAHAFRPAIWPDEG